MITNIKSDRQIIREFKVVLTKEMRKEGMRVKRAVVRTAPKGKTGNLRKKIKLRIRWDAQGPYARITTSARAVRVRERDGRKITYRYGLAIQGVEHYLQKGLERVPRR